MKAVISLANENNRPFGSWHAAGAFNRDGKLVDARDVPGQLDLQIAVSRFVRPANAGRDRRRTAAYRPKLQALPLPLDDGYEIGDNHEPRLFLALPVNSGGRFRLPLRVGQWRDTNRRIRQDLQRSGLLVDLLQESGALQILLFELFPHPV